MLRWYYRLIGLMGRVFANGPGDLGSIPGCVIPKTLKMVLDTSLLNTQQHKGRIKGKVEQLRERSSAPLHLGVVAIEKGAFWSLSTTVANYVGITLVPLALRWLCWYFVGSVGIRLVMLAFVGSVGIRLVMLALDIWLHILVILFYPHVV